MNPLDPQPEPDPTRGNAAFTEQLPRTLLTVDVNRRLFTWIIVIAAVVWLATYLLSFRQDIQDTFPTSSFLWGALFGLPSGVMGASLVTVCRKNYFTYDFQFQTITGPGRWTSRKNYPSRGFDRLEYSAYNARIYEVCADGKRHKLLFRSTFAAKRDWEIFVDLLLKHQAGRKETDRQQGSMDEQV